VEVNWLPFQLNANASKAGVNKMEMYMSKFGKSKEEVVQMSQFMKGNFDRAGLPYKFTDQSLTGNTFNSHRLIAYAGSLGPDVQDKLVEALFHAYFAEEKFLNDQERTLKHSNRMMHVIAAFVALYDRFKGLRECQGLSLRLTFVLP